MPRKNAKATSTPHKDKTAPASGASQAASGTAIAGALTTSTESMITALHKMASSTSPSRTITAQDMWGKIEALQNMQDAFFREKEVFGRSQLTTCAQMRETGYTAYSDESMKNLFLEAQKKLSDINQEIRAVEQDFQKLPKTTKKRIDMLKKINGIKECIKSELNALHCGNGSAGPAEITDSPEIRAAENTMLEAMPLIEQIQRVTEGRVLVQSDIDQIIKTQLALAEKSEQLKTLVKELSQTAALRMQNRPAIATIKDVLERINSLPHIAVEAQPAARQSTGKNNGP